MALWDWGRIWGLVGASLWLRSATRLVNTLHYLMSLFNCVQFTSVCPQALSTVGACGDLGRLLIAAALKMANCRVISQPGKLPRNQSFHVPIKLHPHLMENLNFWQSQKLSSSQMQGWIRKFSNWWSCQYIDLISTYVLKCIDYCLYLTKKLDKTVTTTKQCPWMIHKSSIVDQIEEGCTMYRQQIGQYQLSWDTDGWIVLCTTLSADLSNNQLCFKYRAEDTGAKKTGFFLEWGTTSPLLHRKSVGLIKG